MFLGTEFGLYVSIDAGITWTKWKQGFPTVPVTDLAIQPREKDLVIGTFGRSVYVLDDLTPLREIARAGPDLLASPLHLFPPPEALVVKLGPPATGIVFAGDAAYSGQNRPYGARLAFVVTPPDTGKTTRQDKGEKKTAGDSTTFAPDTVQVHIRNNEGDTVRSFRVSVKKGLNTAVWGLDEKVQRMPSRPKPEPGAPEPSGIDALPGTYTVFVSYGKHVDSAIVRVGFDPRLPYTPAEILANTQYLRSLQKRIRTATEAADRLREAQQTMDQITGVIKERTDSTAKKVKDLSTALRDSVKKLNEMIVDREVQGIRNDPSLLESQLSQAVWYSGSSWYAPGASQHLVTDHMVEKLKSVAGAINRFFERDWPKYREAVDSAKISFFKPYEPITVDK
jgi:gas vesicle protein